MYTLTILYPPPDDPAAFDSYYDTVHIPLASRMRGLTGWTIQRVEPRDGAAAPYHLIVQLSAGSREALQEVLDSPAGVAAAQDVPNFATGGAIFLFGEQHTVPAG
jgi:uncharacterized protein (TIGR02118 family)